MRSILRNHQVSRRSKNYSAKLGCVLKLSCRWECTWMSFRFAAEAICRCGTCFGNGDFLPRMCWSQATPATMLECCWAARWVSWSAITVPNWNDCGTDHESILPRRHHARGIIEGIHYYQFLTNIVIPNDRIESSSDHRMMRLSVRQVGFDSKPSFLCDD